ncbi:MAG: DNRLRE domain-containing protein [Candidatus Zixiibacteriota bacterium]|nr:MAG: DNRLRE domain-containing protein [candidate division Zixibacteria bacterium]
MNTTYWVTAGNAVENSCGTKQGLSVKTQFTTGQPALSVNDVTVTEGNTGTVTATFTVSLSEASGSVASVNYGTVDNSATAGSDYLATGGTLTFPAGTTVQTFTVQILGDTLDEGNETYTVTLSSPVNATIADGAGTGTITDDDNPALSISDVAVTEGDSGSVSAVFTVTLSTAGVQTATVDYSTANGTAVAGTDYTAAGGTLTFAPGVTQQPLTVTVSGDTVVEGNETFFVNLSNPGNAVISDGQGLGTIVDDDGSGTLCSSPVATLTATADTFISGQSSQQNTNFGANTTIDVLTEGSSQVRRGLIQFNLGSIPANSIVTCAALLLNQESGTDTGHTIYVHRLITGWSESTATWNTPWTAAGGDYDPTSVGSFVPDTLGLRAVNISTLAQFWVDNPASNFGLMLRAEDPTAPPYFNFNFASKEHGASPPPRLVVEYIPGLTIADASVSEGNSGTTGVVFTVTLSAVSAQTVTVDYATADSTATTANNDYQAAFGTLTFTPGITVQTVSVLVNGDVQHEPDETFLVNLSNPTNAGISDGQGVGTILNDELGGMAVPGGPHRIFLPLIIKFSGPSSSRTGPSSPYPADAIQPEAATAHRLYLPLILRGAAGQPGGP